MAQDKKTEGEGATRRVLENLLNSRDFSSFESSNQEDFVEESFCDYLSRLAESKGISKSDMIKNSGIERTYAYQLLRGLRNPTRDKVLQFAIGLGLDLEETQGLLRAAHHSALYPRIKRDAAIIFGLAQHLSYTDILILLDKIGEIPLE